MSQAEERHHHHHHHHHGAGREHSGRVAAGDQPRSSLQLDLNFAMADFVGPENGLTEEDFHRLQPRLEQISQQIQEWRHSGRIGFFDLPYQDPGLKEIKKLARGLKEWCWDLVVLGIGGSALGAKALHQALCHPSHNFFPPARRHYNLRLFVLDNIDPDTFYGTLDGMELRRVAVNVVSKSGTTAETLAQFLFLYGILRGRLGDRVYDRVVVTTDPEKGPLRQLAQKLGFPSLEIPPNVGGRFSVLTAVGLFPAACVGIDIEELLAGARAMADRIFNTPPADNPAYRLAACYYLFVRAKNRPIHVFMPYATSLTGITDWICQLWGESLGKRVTTDGRVVHAGPTPVRAVGATDQHSQLQLYMEGPPDKLITFLEVEKFRHEVKLPDLFPDLEALHYLGGHTMAELLAAEKLATAFNLMKAGRPNLTLRLPELTEFVLGQLIYLYEVTTVITGCLLEINPFDQPGVEGGKQTTYGLMGRPGFEARREEIVNFPKPLRKYII